jgi:hypothetical protein
MTDAALDALADELFLGYDAEEAVDSVPDCPPTIRRGGQP